MCDVLYYSPSEQDVDVAVQRGSPGSARGGRRASASRRRAGRAARGHVDVVPERECGAGAVERALTHGRQDGQPFHRHHAPAHTSTTRLTYVIGTHHSRAHYTHDHHQHTPRTHHAHTLYVHHHAHTHAHVLCNNSTHHLQALYVYDTSTHYAHTLYMISRCTTLFTV